MVHQHSRSHLTQEALQAHAKTLEADVDGDVVASLPRTPSGEFLFFKHLLLSQGS